jgi:hypothetical protein
MGDKDNNDTSTAADSISRRRPRRLLLFGAAATGLALVLALVCRESLLRGLRSDDDLGQRVPPDVLADYLPEDSEAVLSANVRQLLESPIGRRRLSPLLRQLVGQAQRRMRWLDLAGINLIDDLDTLQISFAPNSGGQPLWLGRGRFSRSRFRVGPDELQESRLDGFRVWQCSDRSAQRTTLLAAVGDTLVVTETRSRMQAALKQASEPHPIHVRNADLRELLNKVDRRQSIWLAARIESFGSLLEIDNSWLKMVLRPLLAHAESVYGGIACTEDVRAEFHFVAATQQDAAQLERDLQSVRDLARDGSWLLGLHKEMPLLRLLGAGQISRDGKRILLQSRLTADQLDR